MFTFCFVVIGPLFGRDIVNSIFDLVISKSRSWPRSNPMVTFWGLEFNRHVCFCFVAAGPILAKIWRIPYLTLKFEGQGHDENRPKSNQVIYRSGPPILSKLKKNPKSCSEVIAWTSLCGRRRRRRRHRWSRRRRRRRRRTNRYRNIKLPPVYRGDLISNRWIQQTQRTLVHLYISIKLQTSNFILYIMLG